MTMRQIALVCLIGILLNFSEVTGLPMITKTGCHEDGGITLSCSTGVIKLMEVHYGWYSSKNKCDWNLGGERCNKLILTNIGAEVPNFMSDFNTNCTEKSSCIITTQPFYIKDCGENSTYIKITYTCNSKDDPNETTRSTSTTIQSSSEDKETSTLPKSSPTIESNQVSQERTTVSLTEQYYTTQSTETKGHASTTSGDYKPLGQSDKEDMDKVAIIAGSVAGGVVLLVIIIIVVIVLVRRKKQTPKQGASSNLYDVETDDMNSSGQDNPGFSVFNDQNEGFKHNQRFPHHKYVNTSVPTLKNRTTSDSSDIYAKIQDGAIDRRVSDAPSSVGYAEIQEENVQMSTFKAKKKRNIPELGEIYAEIQGDEFETRPSEVPTGDDYAEVQDATSNPDDSDGYADPYDPLKDTDSSPVKDNVGSNEGNNSSEISDKNNPTSTLVPHSEVNGELYAETVKMKPDSKLSNRSPSRSPALHHNPVKRPTAMPPPPPPPPVANKPSLRKQEGATDVPHEEVGGDLYAQPVKALKEKEEFEMIENDIYEI